MSFKKLIFFVLLTLICLVGEAKSQNKIELKDSILLVGEEYYLPVYANLQVQKGDTVRVILRAITSLRFGYNFDVAGNSNSIMDSLGPFVLENHIFNDNIRLDSSQVDVSFVVKNPNASKLFDLILHTTAGKDSIDTIIPAELYINNKVTKFTSIKGTYKFNSFVFQKNDDRLEYNFPNPFDFVTKVPFTLANDSDIKFKLFSEHGRLIDEIPNSNNEIDYYLRKFGSNDDIVGNGTYKLIKGTYELYLVGSFKFSAGGYVLIMQNGENETSIKLLFEK